MLRRVSSGSRYTVTGGSFRKRANVPYRTDGAAIAARASYRRDLVTGADPGSCRVAGDRPSAVHAAVLQAGIIETAPTQPETAYLDLSLPSALLVFSA